MRDNPIGLGILFGALLWSLIFWACGAAALTDSSRVPVLLYHSRTVGPTCSAADTDVLAFERDAQALRAAGYTLRPLIEVAYWQAGIWPGDRLPAKVAAISFDDGFDRDWLSGVPSRVAHPTYRCHGLPSVREIAERHQIPVTYFVIGSRETRKLVQPDYFGDNWWLSAEQHYLFDIGNHSLDHDHIAVTQKTLEQSVSAYVPASGYADGRWAGTFDPGRWTNYESASTAIAKSASYIRRTTGEWPQLLAYPMGYASGYVLNYYMPLYSAEHHTVAAFCAGGSALVTKASDRWCLPRITFGLNWQTAEQLRAIVGAD